ncbi:MAG: phosphatase PAP2 family protein [Bacteroidetes bacterium]|nr:phosphatase PAP2 family protein [Bacteroidota bacterium]
MNKYVVILILIVWSNCSAVQPDSTDQNLIGTIEKDMSSAGNNASYIVGEVGSLSWKSVAILTAVGAGSYIVSIEDEQLRTTASEGHTKTWDSFNNAVREFGGTYSIVGVAGGLYAGGLLFGSEEVRTTGRLVAEGLIVSGLVNGTLKVLFGRARPYMNTGSTNFQWLESSNDFQSFPSGHTTVAFTISTVLASQINRWWATIPLYGLAAATGYSRMYHDKHWASDVFLGAAIGYLSGKLIVSAEEHRQITAKTHTSEFRLYPTLGGIGLIYKF